MKWLLAVIALLLSLPALAHEGDSQEAIWYRSLLTRHGTSCCNMNDCGPVDAKLEGGHWQAFVRGAWIVVPDELVQKRENPIGRPVICMHNGFVLCFVPGDAT